MRKLGFTALIALFVFPAGAALAQAGSPSPIATDRPGFLFSSLTVGPHVFQAELGVPSVTLVSDSGVDIRSSSLFALFRYGVTDRFELRLDAPIYTETRVTAGGLRATDHGYGDVELGAKWHLVDDAGARPSFALIPSVILPTGEKGFSAGDPVYQLNTASEWSLANGWGLAALAGYLNGPSGDGRYDQGTFALSLGRSLPSPAWSAYGEAAYVTTNLDGAADSSFLGAGVKYLVNQNVQLDLSFDRGLTSDSPDWLLGLGFSARF